MLVYDLCCTQGHEFEGWFDSLEDLEQQIARGQVSCPVCGEAGVRRVPSSFAIAKKGAGLADQEVAARMLGKALTRYFKENFDDVGPKFASEALKIHYGVREARNIRGVSTPQEEQMLQEEGVRFFKFGTGERVPDDDAPDGPASEEGDED